MCLYHKVCRRNTRRSPTFLHFILVSGLTKNLEVGSGIKSWSCIFFLGHYLLLLSSNIYLILIFHNHSRIHYFRFILFLGLIIYNLLLTIHICMVRMSYGYLPLASCFHQHSFKSITSEIIGPNPAKQHL